MCDNGVIEPVRRGDMMSCVQVDDKTPLYASSFFCSIVEVGRCPILSTGDIVLEAD